MTALPHSGSAIVRSSDWAPGDLPGERVRPLLDDPAGYSTRVSTVLPGPLGVRHAHDEVEQIYVLEGDFFDEEASYGPGDFVVRMPGTMHRAGSLNGCTMLIVFAPLTPTRR